MDFDSVLIGIQAAKYDCAMSGITVTPAREKNMLFTAPYYNAAQVIVVKEGSAIAGKAKVIGPHPIRSSFRLSISSFLVQRNIKEGMRPNPQKADPDAFATFFSFL
jgi:ABC-type amino acid transport substrate-binding protein